MPHPLADAKRIQPSQKSTPPGTTQAQPTTLTPVTPGLIRRMSSDPSRLPASDLLYLQRTIGNRAVAQMLGRGGDRQGVSTSPVVQPKLKVGPSNDRYEQAADNVAKQVTQTQSPVAQRSSETSIPMVGIPVVGTEGGTLDNGIATAIHHEQSSGSPLSRSIRRSLEPHLGRDLSQVRTHANKKSAQLNSQLGAKAFTHGRDIFYGAGQSPSDIQLTAHEATHFVQQQNPPGTGGHTAGNTVQRNPGDNNLTSSQDLVMGPDHEDSIDDDFGGDHLDLSHMELNETNHSMTGHSMTGRQDPIQYPDDDNSMGNHFGGDDFDMSHVEPDEIERTRPKKQDLIGSFNEEGPLLSAGYLEDGGSSRWVEDTTSGRTSRRAFSKIDTSLQLYQKYKSEKRGNVEAQVKLLNSMKDSLITSRYLFPAGKGKRTKTFNRRKQAATLLLGEIQNELRSGLFRVLQIASKDEMIKELQRAGFSAKFLSTLPEDALHDFYIAHAALSHQHLDMAQKAFDRLNPLKRNKDGGVQYKERPKQYFARTSDDLHFAQQILTSHHHAKIGGNYARVVKAEPLDDSEVNKYTEKYIRNPAFLGDTAVNTHLPAKNDEIPESDDEELPTTKYNSGLQTLKSVKEGETRKVPLHQIVKEQEKYGLTSQEIEAIRLYTGGTYRELNATLHDFRLTNPKEQRNLKGYMAISHMAVQGLRKLPSYSNENVYRGDGSVGGLPNTAQPGTTFQTPGFMSTTVTPGVAAGFPGSVYWHMTTAPDSKGKDIRPISVTKEGEILFPPGTKIEVVDVLRLDRNSQKVNGESEDDKFRRWFPSDSGNPMPDSVLDFLKKARVTDRETVIIVKEHGAPAPVKKNILGKPKQAPDEILGNQDKETGYLDHGGRSNWQLETTSGRTSRRVFSDIDSSMKLYRQYKSKDRGNAEAQAKLLLGMKQWLESSNYTGGGKNSKTFAKRQQATTKLLEEINRELQTNPRRLSNVAGQAEVIKELVKAGFSTKYLGTLSTRDLRDLYLAHAALAHGQHELAQEVFDRLNPIERDKSGSILYSGNYMKRSQSKFLVAQQTLMARHHNTIGGVYSETFKGAPMDQSKMEKVTDKYIRNEDFLAGPGKVEESESSSEDEEGRFEPIEPEEGRFESIEPSEENELPLSHPLSQIMPPGAKKEGPFMKTIRVGNDYGAKKITDLVEHYKAQKLTHEELEAIRIYSHNIFKQMNATMHDFRVANPKEQRKFKGYMALNQVATSGLSKLPSYTGRAVYRGDSDVGGLVETAQMGTMIQTPSFMSTTKSQKQAGKFGTNVAWYIKLAQKSKGKDLAGIAYGTNEEEVLFPPGTKLQIVDVYRSDGASAIVPGQDAKAQIRRIYHSDSGRPIDQNVADFIAVICKAKLRRTIFVVKEVGKK